MDSRGSREQLRAVANVAAFRHKGGADRGDAMRALWMLMGPVPRLAAAVGAAALLVTVTMPGITEAAGTRVPGHQRLAYDTDENGFPDAGVYVNGHYESVYTYDANGDWYWVLGDGRVQGTVASVDDLDAGTLSRCDYVNNYRADFGNDAFMNEGWVQNHIRCSGYDGASQYNYLIVSQTDPRYTGHPDNAIWGTWEYHVLTASGAGNLAKTGPQNHTP